MAQIVVTSGVQIRWFEAQTSRLVGTDHKQYQPHIPYIMPYSDGQLIDLLLPDQAFATLMGDVVIPLRLLEVGRQIVLHQNWAERCRKETVQKYIDYVWLNSFVQLFQGQLHNLLECVTRTDDRIFSPKITG